MTLACDETQRVDIGTDDLCYGWLEDGHPWHGCTLEPGHGPQTKRRQHLCKCGHTWTAFHP